MHVNDKQSSSVNSSRRKALKKIAAGGAVAGLLAVSGKWSKPVVDSIILPAHAQATNATAPGANETTMPAPTIPAPTTTVYWTSGSFTMEDRIIVTIDTTTTIPTPTTTPGR